MQSPSLPVADKEELDRLKQPLIDFSSAKQIEEAVRSKSASVVVGNLLVAIIPPEEILKTVATDKRVPQGKVALCKEKFDAIFGIIFPIFEL